jgi:hypothetical protein
LVKSRAARSALVKMRAQLALRSSAGDRSFN